MKNGCVNAKMKEAAFAVLPHGTFLSCFIAAVIFLIQVASLGTAEVKSRK